MGLPLEFFAEMQQVERLLQRFDLYRGAQVMRFDHFNCQMPDVDAAYAWYADLGFGCSEYTVGDQEQLWAVWLQRKGNVHDLALMNGVGPRVHHLGFWLADTLSALRACDVLAAAGWTDSIERGPGRHGISNAFFPVSARPGRQPHRALRQRLSGCRSRLAADSLDARRSTPRDLLGPCGAGVLVRRGRALRVDSGWGCCRSTLRHSGIDQRTSRDQAASDTIQRRVRWLLRARLTEPAKRNISVTSERSPARNAAARPRRARSARLLSASSSVRCAPTSPEIR